MSQLIPHYKHNKDDNRPLPERLIDEIGGSITIYEMKNGQKYYCVRDWVYWVSGSKSKQLHSPWSDLKRKLKKQKSEKFANNMRELNVETDGGVKKMDFTDEKGLYLITQRMSDRSGFVRGIKKYLADAGVFVDAMARDIERYKRMGREDSWIEARIRGKVTRHHFTAALRRAVIETLTSEHYGATTETIYTNLWERTTNELRIDLEIGRKGNIRDHMGELALIYTRITEMVCTRRLQNIEHVPFEVAREIVAEIAQRIHRQAKDTSYLLGIDLVTERPLLGGGVYHA